MFDKLMVSRSWWGEGTKSFFEESFVVKGSKRQNEEKERPSQTLMRSPEQVYSQPSHRCTFVQGRSSFTDSIGYVLHKHPNRPVSSTSRTFPTFPSGSKSEFRLPTPPRDAR